MKIVRFLPVLLLGLSLSACGGAHHKSPSDLSEASGSAPSSAPASQGSASTSSSARRDRGEPSIDPLAASIQGAVLGYDPDRRELWLQLRLAGKRGGTTQELNGSIDSTGSGLLQGQGDSGLRGSFRCDRNCRIVTVSLEARSGSHRGHVAIGFGTFENLPLTAQFADSQSGSLGSGSAIADELRNLSSYRATLQWVSIGESRKLFNLFLDTTSSDLPADRPTHIRISAPIGGGSSSVKVERFHHGNLLDTESLKATIHFQENPPWLEIHFKDRKAGDLSSIRAAQAQGH